MKNYEAVFILSPELSKEAVQKLTNEVKKSIESANGERIVEEKLEKRQLQYPIKKQKEGIYFICQFTAPPQAIAKIKDAFKHNESILRYAFIAVDKRQSTSTEKET
uniref:Small ribosomal subunit protein bS6 n=1 Tax=candidate division WOR-3 bacterium TaxID=2052148 RepID=A0A7C6A810_UNCW3